MLKKAFIIICLTFIMMLDYVVQAKPDLTIEVEPSRFELRLAPAETATGSILLKNRSGKRMLVSAAVNDWDMSINGFSAFFKPGSQKDSCAGWIALNPNKFTIDPGKQQIVKFTLRRPQDVSMGEYRCAMFFNAQAAVPDRNDATGNLAAVVAMYCNSPDAQRQGRIINAVAHYDAKLKTVESQLEVESTGNAHLRFEGAFEVKGEDGKTVGRGNYYGNVVFPGHRLLLKGLCQCKLTPGKYTVSSFLKFQKPPYAAGELGWEEYSGGLRQLEAAAELLATQGG